MRRCEASASGPAQSLGRTAAAGPLVPRHPGGRPFRSGSLCCGTRSFPAAELDTPQRIADSLNSCMDLRLAAYFLVILNPFSQVLFLWDLMKEMRWGEFNWVYARASLLSFGVYAIFAVTGDLLFVDVFHVRLGAFQIFGGLIVFMIALRYFTQGPGSNQFVRGTAYQLAPSISLPFMVGPATIWVSILIGRSLPFPADLLHIAAVLLVNFLVVALMHRVVFRLEGRKDTLLGAYFTILMRTNAFFIGAIGIEMMLSGLERVISGSDVANGL